MERTNFENLRVYQLAEVLQDVIWDVVMSWKILPAIPSENNWSGLRIVSHNIAEGSGRGSVLDNRRFVRMARGSLYETKHWLRRAYKRKLPTSQQIDSLKQTVEELTRTLNGYLRSLKSKD